MINSNICEIDGCNSEAEFDSPANICEFHWKLWWYSGIFEDIDPWDLPKNITKEEREFFIRVRQDGEFLEIENTPTGKIIIFSSRRIYN